MKILVTGGAGYIGIHTLVELIDAGYTPVVVDNLSNSTRAAITAVETITQQTIDFFEGDIRNSESLRTIFTRHGDIAAVVHFAGLKAVGESVAQPLTYYDNNITGTLTLLKVMTEFNCKTLIFSSSATVYQESTVLPLREDFPLATTNPYGRSKLMIENILRDLFVADSSWRIAILRYFNPVGAHKSGLIGENPKGIPNNLMPFIAQVAAGIREKLQVFGSDYPTKDGTGVRDYIHVVDLARGHVKAIEALVSKSQVITVNLGTGVGYSVLEMLHAFEQVSGKKVPYEIVARRVGDIAECYADSGLAQQLLGWKAALTLQDMCEDVWRWQKNHDEIGSIENT